MIKAPKSGYLPKQQSMIAGLHHVSLIIADVDQSLDFYCGLLGLSEAERPETLSFPGAWLDIGRGQQIHLLQLPNPDPVDERPEHGGRDRHMALWVRDIDMLAVQLESANVPFTQSVSGRKALFCRDPDGNGLEFMAFPEE